MKYYYATRIETNGGATEIDDAQVVLAEDYDRLWAVLKRVAAHHAGGCTAAMLAVAEARAEAERIEAEDD